MPGPFGLTSTGFNLKTLDDIIGELEADERANLGATVDLSPATVLGQLNAIFGRQAALVWEAVEAVHTALDPDQAGGTDLVALAAITGTVPDPSTRSTVNVTATGTNGTVIPAGRIFSVQNGGSRFLSTAAVTIAGGTATIPCVSEEYGAIQAYAGTLNQIITPVGGLTTITNPLDAVPGREGESDSSLRLRREAELRASGDATAPSIQADVRDVEGVTAVKVFVNDTDAAVDGLTPHSIEVLVQGGTESAIRQAIYETKGAGIETIGSVVGTVMDSEGIPVTIRFSRPTAKFIYVTLVVQKDADFPATGITDIEAAIVAAGNTGLVGQDVKRARLYGPVFKTSGVVDVPFMDIGFTLPAVGGTQDTHLTIGAREVAVFDTSRVDVNIQTVTEDSGSY